MTPADWAWTQVAPHAGAWIETEQFCQHRQIFGSRPMRARGLKQEEPEQGVDARRVAPHAGAWIETEDIILSMMSSLSRAPCGRVD